MNLAELFAARADVHCLHVPELLTPAFASDVSSALQALDASIKVVVLVGASAEVFSLGMDLEGFVRSGADAGPAVKAIGSALNAIQQCSRATLGIASGRAVGGGVGLLAACDFVLAETHATFALPELLWGFVPAAIWPLVAARIGAARARTWALTAGARDAGEALAAGLLDEVAPASEMPRAASRVLRQLARADREAIGLLRSWSDTAGALPLAEAIERGAILSAEQLNQARVRERLQRYFVDGEMPWEVRT